MQNVKEDLRLLTETVMRSDTKDHTNLVERCYADNAIMESPMFHIRGSANIGAMFKSWSRAVSKMSCTINDIIYDDEKKVALIDVTQHINFRMIPFTIDWRVQSKLMIVDAEGGKKISKQEDCYPLQGIVRSTAMTRIIYDNLVLPAGNMGTTMFTKMMGEAVKSKYPPIATTC
mmetsp:Transcript_28460/g.40146  ORF Transcript_28460/g.40146 Transcript_28460/m.40146 type:complete len:174 (-) Transcript_28460:7-528(-)